jgi:hypothetical protein
LINGGSYAQIAGMGPLISRKISRLLFFVVALPANNAASVRAYSALDGLDGKSLVIGEHNSTKTELWTKIFGEENEMKLTVLLRLSFYEL